MFGGNATTVIPAIDVQDGEVVQLVQGQRGTERRYGDPETAAERWIEAGASALHLVDLDGAFEGRRANADAIAAVVEAVDVPVQLGGGIRTAEEARALLDGGIDRVILGTAAMASPALVETLGAEYPDRIVVSLDAKAGEVVVEGWTAGTGIDPVEAASRFADRGAGAILFTDVDVEGQLAGVSTDRIAAMADAVSIPIVASGGVASVDDLRALGDAGADAVVVGTALYEGRFSLREAQQALDGQ